MSKIIEIRELLTEYDGTPTEHHFKMLLALVAEGALPAERPSHYRTIDLLFRLPNDGALLHRRRVPITVTRHAERLIEHGYLDDFIGPLRCRQYVRPTQKLTDLIEITA